MKKGVKRAEFFLVVIIAALLIGSLLSEKYFEIPTHLTSILILAFVIIKLIDIVKLGGTIFEDFVSLALIVIFGIVHFFLKEQTNVILTTVAVFILIYSVGLIPWINDIIKSRKVSYFILSYGFFVLMVIFLFAGAYFANNNSFTYNGEKTTINFEDSLYFSTISFTTVGYGEYSPTGVNKFIASLQAIMGMILNIAFIGHILSSQRFRKR